MEITSQETVAQFQILSHVVSQSCLLKYGRIYWRRDCSVPLVVNTLAASFTESIYKADVFL